MDFVTHLPQTSRTHDAVWVIVDRLTKSVHFLADRLKTRYVKRVPKCASVRVAPSNIVYYCTDIDPQGKVN